ncbi:MAG: HAD hydrolase-like protein [Candidatus Margulisbacteria bacterium]|jgi:phosphoglycolate phosphatase|nr:HAD hydrolase-like protein [Candidatus Margulisiibacteriota bacterium]
MTAYDLLLFDLDGTLADSLPAAVSAVQAMLAELKYPPKSVAEINGYIGFGEVALVAGSIGTTEPEKVEQARARYYHYVRESIPTVPLFPRVAATLWELKPPKIVLSNKRDEFIRLILEHHGLVPAFAEILGGDSAPCLKPDPCAIIGLIKKYRVAPERVLLIGDMTVDIETGKNAGVKTCGVTYGFDGLDKLAAHRPDYLIDDFARLREIVG